MPEGQPNYENREASVEFQLAKEQEQLMITTEKIRENLDGLEALSDDEIATLKEPRLADKIRAALDCYLDKYTILGGFIGSTAAEFIVDAPGLERTLTKIGVGAAAATIIGVMRLMFSEKKELFSEYVNDALKARLENAAEAKENT
jgi:hypothetical protein